MVAFLPQLAAGTGGVFSLAPWPISGIFPKTSPAGLSPSKPIETDTGSLVRISPLVYFGPHVLPGHIRPLPAPIPLLARLPAFHPLPARIPPAIFPFPPYLGLKSLIGRYPPNKCPSAFAIGHPDDP